MVNAFCCLPSRCLQGRATADGACKLQAQVAGPAADVHVSTARHGTASASQMQEQEDAEQQPAQQQQRQAQQQQQQQQQQWQQQTIKQASPSPERHLQHSTDVTESLNGQQAGLPDSANAVLQQLLQQSRAPQLWPADKVSALVHWQRTFNTRQWL